jgi:hypothetical protein
MYNFNIAVGKDFSNDIFYDGVSLLIRSIGFPPSFFFVIVSFTLIFSIFFFIKFDKLSFVFTSILMYSYSMQQSENLMRQYFAISFLLIASSYFLLHKYKIAIFFCLLTVLSHSSVVFVFPLFCIYLFLLNPNPLSKYLFKSINIIFIVLYFFVWANSEILYHLFFENSFSLNFKLFDSIRYISDDYLLKVHESTSDKNNQLFSIVNYVRNQLRDFFILFFGFSPLSNAKHQSIVISYTKANLKIRTFFFLYIIANFGIIYSKFLGEDYSSEFTMRLGIYLNVFLFCFEGVLLGYFLLYSNLRKFAYYLSFVIVFFELIWILKPQVESTLGYKFIWDQI